MNKNLRGVIALMMTLCFAAAFLSFTPIRCLMIDCDAYPFVSERAQLMKEIMLIMLGIIGGWLLGRGDDKS